MTYSGVLTAELRDANPHTHDAIRRLVAQCGGQVMSIEGTTLRARPGITRSAGELLMRHLLKDPAVISESVAWG
jgi:hypothetical protein